MAHHDPAPNPAMEKALRRLQSGKPAEAEAVVARAAERAKHDHGIDSPQYSSAVNDLGTVLMLTGQTNEAVEAMTAACRFEFPGNEQATRERLTFLLNLGHVLQLAGRHKEAEEALRRGRAAREGFYGRAHPGYAFGLLPLAQSLLVQGRAGEALAVIEETVANFFSNGHPWITKALAVRAEVLAASGTDRPPFTEADSLPAELLHELVGDVTGRFGEADPGVLHRVLRALLPLLERRLGETDQATLNVLAHLANLQGELGDHAARVATIRRVIAAHDAQGDAGQALGALQGLALALSDAGNPGKAEETYREAIDRAAALGDPGTRSQIKRNLGLMMRDLGRMGEAEQWLSEAVTDALAAGDRERAGLARVALGVLIQHAGRLDEARDLLTTALPDLDPAHPHALVGRNHLQAIASNASCGCGDMEVSLAEAFAEFFRSQLPADLIAKLHVEVKDKLEVKVELTRDPTPEELDMLDRVHRHAYEQFRRRVGDQGQR
jgi:tetratricopeptide (TPR) repeat protein